MKPTVGFILVVLAATGLWSPSVAHADACSQAEVTISAPPLSDGDQNAFVEKFRTALGRVCAWWGNEYPGPYHLDIRDNQRTAMALIPAWRGARGHVIFPMRTIRQNKSPITHEIVHVIATNANRFLAEGLAVHAHDALGGQPAFPNFGRDLHSQARPFAPDAHLQALERIAVPARLKLPDLDVQPSYLVAGSFVRYLIETHGLEKFRDLYRRTPLEIKSRDAGSAGRWRQVYGVSFETLVAQWKAKLAG